MTKFIFANQLRTLAALSVVLSHWCVLYWGMPDLVAAFSASVVLPRDVPLAFHLARHDYFNLGPFGVAIFFLISGFVIPFSVAKAPPLGFVGARLLRIYPTYMVGLCIGLGALWVSGQFWGKEFPWDRPTIVANMLLYNNLVEWEMASIDMVNWSLAVELKFYLLALLLAPAIRRAQVLPLLGFGLLAFLVNWYLPTIIERLGNPAWHRAAKALATEAMYMSYMLIGTFFSYAVHGKLSSRKLLWLAALQLSLFELTWRVGPAARQFPRITSNYYYAFCVFAVAYVYRDRFRTRRGIDWLADISYPLYVIHALVGYVLLKLLMYYGLPYYLALLLTFAVVVSLAHAVHVIVEAPTTALGKRLSRARVASNG